MAPPPPIPALPDAVKDGTPPRLPEIPATLLRTPSQLSVASLASASAPNIPIFDNDAETPMGVPEMREEREAPHVPGLPYREEAANQEIEQQEMKQRQRRRSLSQGKDKAPFKLANERRGSKSALGQLGRPEVVKNLDTSTPHIEANTNATERTMGQAAQALAMEEEIRRLRERVHAQNAELRHVKRVLVMHSMFFKWKVWHLSRVRERAEADMEEERMQVARRISTAVQRLQAGGEFTELEL
ncbi:Hypothetical Protein FCC1311_051562 [Hondaea fermentalgiana]|uniref:Uncharacterized protein n=1 Tax=Hondaea fermentalgiana TaxID=2315210 RepID=A0A2R5GEF5_9STRA|nr:Hypothetical Protein FCC1311_051562 [Hondaea fermentalgiana]|eukprot:GBG28935.1 Hypothetical Protein FCC1311_051562 [Hondaea fermentalgiana]